MSRVLSERSSKLNPGDCCDTFSCLHVSRCLYTAANNKDRDIFAVFTAGHSSKSIPTSCVVMVNTSLLVCRLEHSLQTLLPFFNAFCENNDSLGGHLILCSYEKQTLVLIGKRDAHRRLIGRSSCAHAAGFFFVLHFQLSCLKDFFYYIL